MRKSMKRLMIMALVVMAGAYFNISTASAGKPKKKAKDAVESQQLRLQTPSDSLSYAAGKAATLGLIQYLQQQFQVDTAYIGDVIQGYKDATEQGADPHFKAYSAGLDIARTALERILPGTQAAFEGSPDSIKVDYFNAGFLSGLANDTSVYTLDKARQLFETRQKADQEIAHKAYKEANEHWLADNKTKDGVKETDSGLQYKVLREGTGAIPTKDDRVTVKYEGRMIDGTVFDSSYKRDPQTSTFGVSQVIKGWTEALTMMPVGSKWELYIPQQLGYGSRQAGSIKPYSTLIFTVELDAIEKAKNKK